MDWYVFVRELPRRCMIDFCCDGDVLSRLDRCIYGPFSVYSLKTYTVYILALQVLLLVVL